jgi:SOS-response transcriptional repressor LexA
MKDVTLKEYVIFCFIRQFLEDYDKSPTRKEIAKAFSISIQGADYFVQQLQKKSIIQLKQQGIRNIKILKKYLAKQTHLF